MGHSIQDSEVYTDPLNFQPSLVPACEFGRSWISRTERKVTC